MRARKPRAKAAGARPHPPKRAPSPRSANGQPPQAAHEEPEGSLDDDLKSILSQDALKNGQKHMRESTTIQCPYCGEGFEVHLDTVEDGQMVYEDCHICCKPIVLNVHVDEDDEVTVSAYRA